MNGTKKFYFVNFFDGFFKLMITIIPIIFSVYTNIRTGNYEQVMIPVLFGILSSEYFFIKVYLHSDYKKNKLIFYPSLIAIITLGISLVLLAFAFVELSLPQSVTNQTYSNGLILAAIFLYMPQLIVIIIETIRVIGNDSN